MNIFLSAWLEPAHTTLVIKYSDDCPEYKQFVCEEWRLECPTDRAEENTEMPEDDSGERGCVSRESDSDRDGRPSERNWPCV